MDIYKEFTYQSADAFSDTKLNFGKYDKYDADADYEGEGGCSSCAGVEPPYTYSYGDINTYNASAYEQEEGFFQKNKKTIIIVSIVLVVSIILYVLYRKQILKFN